MYYGVHHDTIRASKLKGDGVLKTTKTPMVECPHCGSDYGFYTRQQACGMVQYQYSFNGEEKDNSQMYDLLKFTGGIYAYCLDCNKRLFKMSDLGDLYA